MPGLLTYAVGDIHGSFTKLTNLHRHCLDHCAGKPHRFVFLGDYVDRGKRSQDVVNFLFKAQSRAPEQFICLKGNHEDMLVRASQHDNVAMWLDNGGDMTLRSYGVSTAVDIPADHLEWFAALPLTISDEKRFYVHAGIMPGVPLQKQSKDVMLWIREPFLSDRSEHGLFIVHGHTPTETRGPDFLPNRLNLDTLAWLDGRLTAAVFDERVTGPLAFITDDGKFVKAPMITELEQA
jgi:serine/threonine protein phosphatase 1